MTRVVLGLTEDNVRRMYYDLHMSTIKIAHSLGCSSEAIRKAMKRWNIERRPQKESVKGRDFSPEHIEKLRNNMAKINARQKRENHPSWKNGKWFDKDGYVIISKPNGSRQKEHRYVMEQSIGRKLMHNEDVHHKDRDRKNNDIFNLELMTKAAHQALHWDDYKKKLLLDGQKEYWEKRRTEINVKASQNKPPKA